MLRVETRGRLRQNGPVGMAGSVLVPRMRLGCCGVSNDKGARSARLPHQCQAVTFSKVQLPRPRSSEEGVDSFTFSTLL